MFSGVTSALASTCLVLTLLCVSGPARALAPSFTRGSTWTDEVSAAPLDPESDAVIAWLEDAGGWGLGRFQIDFSFEVLEADESAPLRSFEPTADHFSPDCDFDSLPVPDGGALEGESGYACSGDGDCHLLVHDTVTRRLYEMWRADIDRGDFRGGCLAVWNLEGEYPSAGRGEGCTSADAAGFPIAPLLADADEVAAGEVAHALRFILPNSRIRDGVYVHPATHSTGATSGGSDAPPYGARFRLRADYPVETLPSQGARVLARTLQRYGMFLSDGGSVVLTVRSDRSTAASWNGLLGPHDLRDLQVSDFEMVDAGPRFSWDGECTRLPRPQRDSCADDVDNDDDGAIDEDDLQCAADFSLSESPRRSCGLGLELAPCLALILRRRRATHPAGDPRLARPGR